MIQALLSSVDSLQAQQTRMDVIGNDLANINTTAYKNQDVQFETLISQQLTGPTAPNGSLGGTNGINYGLGVKVGATTTNMAQGTLTATANPSDLAIQGNGYFMTSNGQQSLYTRDGSFEIDSNGNVVSADTGMKVLGWTADSEGKIDTTKQIAQTDSLKIPIGALDAAQATSKATLAGNLSATAGASDTGTVTTTVYDALGNAHDVTIVYSNPTSPAPTTPTPPTGATSSWQWNAYLGDNTSGTAIGSSADTGNSLLYFNAQGQSMTDLASGTFNQISIPASGTSAATPISLDMSEVGQLGSATSVQVTQQNGYPAGSLSSYTIGPDGTIVGSFTNGLTQTLGQIAVASFANPAGLTSVGSNVFTTSPNSGPAIVGQADTGANGSINSGYLEQSNVDLSTSLTNLIVTQRGFEANTKMVTTVDQMLQDIIEMKH